MPTLASPYNLTNITNANNIPDLIISSSVNLSDGWFGTIIISAVLIILLINFKGYDNRTAFSGATFISALLAIVFFWLGLINVTVLLMFLVLGGIGMIFLKL